MSMNSLIPKFLEDPNLYAGHSATLRVLGEFKGRQDIYLKLEEDALETLRSLALIESLESSNRLEGIITTHIRMRDIVLRSSKPKNRSEQEIAGYRDALAHIHKNWKTMQMDTQTIKQLHGMIYKFLPSGGGNWKQTENVILEKYNDGTMHVRFRPVSVKKTPSAMEDMVLGYNDSISSGKEPMVIIPFTILDFLCIHPFSDGNGRMARLLTLLLLYKAGYRVGRYISLERIFEQSKESYYETLQASSIGWHEGEHDIVPWTTYFWGVIIAAYKEFESRVGSVKSFYGSKTEMIHQAIERHVGPFSISEIQDACPGISRVMIRTILRQMRDEGQIRSTGIGRGAKWVMVDGIK
jgi:Fic family protein